MSCIFITWASPVTCPCKRPSNERRHRLGFVGILSAHSHRSKYWAHFSVTYLPNIRTLNCHFFNHTRVGDRKCKPFHTTVSNYILWEHSFPSQKHEKWKSIMLPSEQSRRQIAAEKTHRSANSSTGSSHACEAKDILKVWNAPEPRPNVSSIQLAKVVFDVVFLLSTLSNTNLDTIWMCQKRIWAGILNETLV